MFEVQVFSDPVVALVGPGGLLPNEELHLASEYDEQLVKPALFLADRVTLRSHRKDLLGNEIRDHNMASFPVPLFSRLLVMSQRRDPRELAVLDMNLNDLLSESDIGKFSEVLMRDGRPIPDALWEELVDRAEPLRLALMKHHRSRGEALTSQALEKLSLAGLIEDLPWDLTPKTRGQQIRDSEAGENAEFERAFFAMVDEVESSPSSVMLDDVISARVKKFVPAPVHIASSEVVSGAVELVQMIEGLSAVPIDEIADLRIEVDAYVAPFRSFMIEVAGNADLSSGDAAERSRSLKLAWERDVEPAVAEMRSLVASSSFRRNAVDLFATSRDALQTIGIAIGGGLATGWAGVGSLSLVGAVAPPFLAAFVGSVRGKEQARRNRAYLTYAMSRSDVVRRANKR
ncbi:hypothetical protein [Leifsonia sp. C5G2]|uniref:hypothetical protein n=1 Tax=Leifsonia sp. C5G2 TaxID=2735269 RepID=UPI0015846706|nr:hypothetical protein [Leifsonia sp. C5G2]NUU06191.1 hypothetical protein [Leifsonia sp. C5G2]